MARTVAGVQAVAHPVSPERSAAVHLPSPATVCRTVAVLGFLLALALAGTPGWSSVGLGLALVAVWLAPLVVAHARHRAALHARPPEAPAG
jgi:multisubunit Na+/H+ antiporter MnhG subunit